MTSGFAHLAVVAVLLGSNAGILAAQPPRVHAGDDIKRPQLVFRVPPVYPEEAKTHKIGGMVIVEVVIATDGAVRELTVVRKVHPLLDAATVDAVSQWEYTPTEVNGQPVEVVMTVNVTFSPPK